MGKKKKKQQEEKPWCWYCDREFDDEKILIQHQKAKHFKCHICHRKLNTASGMVIHGMQVHKERISVVPNAIPGRETTDIEIFGMEGIPDEDLEAKRVERGLEPGGAKKQKTDANATAGGAGMAQAYAGGPPAFPGALPGMMPMHPGAFPPGFGPPGFPMPPPGIPPPGFGPPPGMFPSGYPNGPPPGFPPGFPPPNPVTQAPPQMNPPAPVQPSAFPAYAQPASVPQPQAYPPSAATATPPQPADPTMAAPSSSSPALANHGAPTSNSPAGPIGAGGLYKQQNADGSVLVFNHAVKSLEELRAEYPQYRYVRV